jgi:hypothetical protein
MNKFNFVYAITWMNWELPIITFYGNSGCYIEKDGLKYIIWDGDHVGTKFGKKIWFSPNTKVPRGFKTYCKSI